MQQEIHCRAREEAVLPAETDAVIEVTGTRPDHTCDGGQCRGYAPGQSHPHTEQNSALIPSEIVQRPRLHLQGCSTTGHSTIIMFPPLAVTVIWEKPLPVPTTCLCTWCCVGHMSVAWGIWDVRWTKVKFKMKAQSWNRHSDAGRQRSPSMCTPKPSMSNMWWNFRGSQTSGGCQLLEGGCSEDQTKHPQLSGGWGSMIINYFHLNIKTCDYTYI